jgi:hypothetical protein
MKTVKSTVGFLFGSRNRKITFLHCHTVAIVKLLPTMDGNNVPKVCICHKHVSHTLSHTALPTFEHYTVLVHINALAVYSLLFRSHVFMVKHAVHTAAL